LILLLTPVNFIKKLILLSLVISFSLFKWVPEGHPGNSSSEEPYPSQTHRQAAGNLEMSY